MEIVFIVDTAIDDVQVAMWGVGYTLQHGADAGLVVGCLTDCKWGFRDFLPAAEEVGVGDDAGEPELQ